MRDVSDARAFSSCIHFIMHQRRMSGGASDLLLGKSAAACARFAFIAAKGDSAEQPPTTYLPFRRVDLFSDPRLHLTDAPHV